MDLFRMRCYLASLQGGELPNPKSLLAATSRPSKLALGRLGVLSVSSFHALVSSWGRLGQWLAPFRSQLIPLLEVNLITDKGHQRLGTGDQQSKL
jgi:hypothetical protein